MFDRACKAVAEAAGSWQAFLCAFALIAIWLVAGLHYGYADQLYELAINSATTIITFLMVFVIQNAQNRDTLAINLKLDELLRSVAEARDDLAGVEDRPAADLRRLKEG